MFVIRDASGIYFRTVSNGFEYWTNKISNAREFLTQDEAEDFIKTQLRKFKGLYVEAL